METRVYREKGWTTVGDWGRQRGTGETTENMETRVYIGNKDGRQRETARDYSDHGDQGSLHRKRGIHNTRRLGEI